MASIEYFEVECPEKTGGRYYQRIADVVLLDHNLIRVIRKIHFFIDPRVPIFVAVGITRKMPGPVRLRDFSDVSVQDDKVTISIGDETYLAKLLESLWDIFGKERVEQPDRFTVVITAVRMRRRISKTSSSMTRASPSTRTLSMLSRSSSPRASK